MVYFIVGVLVLLAVLWVLVGIMPPPDDPWILDNPQVFGHTFRDGMEPGTYDENQQGAAARKTKARQEAVREAHADQPAPPRVIPLRRRGA